jgi:hypothetical protein
MPGKMGRLGFDISKRVASQRALPEPMKITTDHSMNDNQFNLAADINLNLGGRSFTAAVIESNWQRICRHMGKTFVSSAGVLDSMHELGIQYTLDGSKLKKANAIGDILGTKHFKLPSTGTGKRSYYLPAIEMSQAERERFVQLPPAEMVAEIQRTSEEVLSHEVERSDPCNDLAA